MVISIERGRDSFDFVKCANNFNLNCMLWVLLMWYPCIWKLLCVKVSDYEQESGCFGRVLPS